MQSYLNHPRTYLILAVSLCIMALAMAYIGEYFFALKPCPLCLYQRYVFMITAVVASTGVVLSSLIRQLITLFIVGMLFLANGAIAVYQVLIEKGIVSQSRFCKGVQIQNKSFAEFKNALKNAGDVIPCDKVEFEMFGVSMAGYNALFTIFIGSFLLTCCVLIYKKYKRSKRLSP